MTPNYFISSNISHALLKYATGVGLNPAKACQNARFPGELNFDLESRIPVEQFYGLWVEIAEQTHDPNFGLHFVENTHAQPGGDVISAILFNCPNVGNAMEKLARYHDLTTDLIQVQIQQQGEFTRYAWGTALENMPVDRHISEAVICRLFFTLRDLSNGKMPITEIFFRHPRPDSISEHRRIFNCPIQFAQPRDEVIVRRQELEAAIPLANPGLLKRLNAIAEEMLNALYTPDTWSEQVSQWISRLLRQGEKPTIAVIAQKLAVSTRLLQNRIKDEGGTYRALLDQVRKEMALAYLKEPGISIYDTVFLLGFSDQSSFNHAFKRWTGSTPTEYK